MVEVVFQEVVLGKVGDVGLLDMGDVGGTKETDIHCTGVGEDWWKAIGDAGVAGVGC